MACFQDVHSKVDPGKHLKDDKITQNNLHKVNLRNNHLKGSIILGNYGVSISTPLVQLFDRTCAEQYIRVLS